MNRLVLIGVILMVLGLLGFIFPRFVFTQEMTVIEIGPVEVKAEDRNAVTIPDIASGAAVAAGVILTVVGRSRKS